MTFEEAKKILDEELCFVIEKESDGLPLVSPLKFEENEKLRVREAIIALRKLGYEVYYNTSLLACEYRKAMLKREYNERVSSGKVDEFSDSILDELVDGYNGYKKRGKEIARLNEIISKKNAIIKDLLHDRGELVNKLAHLHADVEVGKVNLQALKSAESALVYKENELKRKDDSAKYYANKLVDAYHEIRELKARLKKISEISVSSQEQLDYKNLKEIALKEFLEGKQDWSVLTMLGFADIPLDVINHTVFKV